MYLLTSSVFVGVSRFDRLPINGTSREIGFVVISVTLSAIVGLTTAIVRIPVKNGVYRGFPKLATSAMRRQLAWRMSAFMALLAIISLLFVYLTLPPCGFHTQGRFLCIAFGDGWPLTLLRAPGASLMSFALSMCIASSAGYLIALVRELLWKSR